MLWFWWNAILNPAICCIDWNKELDLLFQWRNFRSTSIGMPPLTDQCCLTSCRSTWDGTTQECTRPIKLKGRACCLPAAQHTDWWNIQRHRDWQPNGFTLHVFVLSIRYTYCADTKRWHNGISTTQFLWSQDLEIEFSFYTLLISRTH